MGVTISCPDAASLERFSVGQASPEEIDRLGDHIVQCEQCIRTLDTLNARDTIVDMLASRPKGEENHAESVRAVIERLKTMMSAGAESRDGGSPATTSDAAPTEEGPTPLDFLSPPQQPDEIGRLAGYRILKLLGQGGMGMVFQAEDPQLKRRVALKVMRPGQANKPESRERFVREARAAAAIEHDHIVTIHQVGEANGVPFLAMPWLKGTSLDELLKQTPGLPISEVIRIGRQVASGLAAAHARGLIHRDIKPGNIWLERKDEGERMGDEQRSPDSSFIPHPSSFRVKILDFGLAKPLEEAGDLTEGAGHITQSGAILGTPSYMAPEQARGDAVDARCDLFSLGVVLYRMCTGRLPFQGATTGAVLMALASVHPESPRQLNPEVPAGLSDLIDQLLAKDPAKRPASAREVGQRLLAIEQVVGCVAGPTSPQSETPPFRGTGNAPYKPSRRWLVAAAILLMLIGGGSFALYQLVFNTSQGTLIVEIDDPKIEARFKEGVLKLHDQDGKLLYTLKPSERNKNLPAGKYKIEVAGADGLTLDTEEFTLKKNGKETVRVLLKPVAVAEEAPEAAWIKEIAALPPDKQVAALIVLLKKHNPGWAGTVRLDATKEGKVTELTIVNSTGGSWVRDDKFRDLTPVRAITGLKKLRFAHLGVFDLSPVKDLPLEELLCCACLVRDLAPVRSMKHLKRLTVMGNPSPLTDLSPLKGLPLTALGVPWSHGMTDLSPLQGMPLTELWVGATGITDLTPLKGMQLKSFSCNEAFKVSDLSPLKGMPLAFVDCRSTKVTDLSPLKGMPLKELYCEEDAERDLDTLRSFKPATLVNGTAVAQIQEELELAQGPFDEWFKKLATLPPQKQVRAVAGRLRLDNPVRVQLLKVEGGKVTGIRISGKMVSDLTPVRALAGLKSLDCEGTSFSDLSQLKGLGLTHLNCGDTGVTDLRPLKGMKLTSFSCRRTRVTDLSPLKDMPLTVLNCGTDYLRDLSPLKGLPLVSLNCISQNVNDLSALKGMPLTELQCVFKPERDAGILRSITTLKVINGRPVAELLGAPAADPDHKAAEWVLALGGSIRIRQGGQERDLNELKDLPATPFALVAVTMILNPNVDDAGLAGFKGLSNLMKLELPGAKVSDTGLVHLKGLTNLTELHLGLTPLSGAGLIHLQGLTNLTRLDLNGTKISNEGLANLEGLSKLTVLNLSNTPVSDAGLKRLAALKALKSLNLNGTKVTDAGLKELAGLNNLHTLHLDSTQVTDVGLKELAALKSLEMLILYNTKVTDAGLKELSRLTSLKHLSVDLTKVTDAGLKMLGTLKSLQTLTLAQNQVTDTGLKELAGLKSLRDLDLGSTPVTDTGLRVLAGLPNLQRLNLGNTQVTDAGLKELAGLKTLQYLGLGTTKVTDAGLKELAGLQNLQVLKLGGTNVTDAGLEHLVDLPAINKLNLLDTRISAKGYAKLKAELPKVKIDWSEPNYSAAVAIAEAGGYFFGRVKGEDKEREIFLHAGPPPYFQITRVLLWKKKILDKVLPALVKLSDPEFDRLEVLQLDESHVTDADLLSLTKLPKLGELNLRDTPISDAGLKHLAGCKALNGLNLTSTAITNAGLKELAGLKSLKDLTLRETKVTATGLSHLAKLPNLERLDLQRLNVSDAGMVHLKDLLNLKILFLQNTNVTDRGLAELKNLRALKSLNLGGTKVTGTGLRELATLKSLQRLDLGRTKVTDVGLKELAGLESLQILFLNSTQVTDAGLKELAGLKSLQSLNLNYTQVTGAGLKELAGLKSLQWLFLDASKVTDAALRELAGLKSLHTLTLSGTPVTDAGLKDLAGLKKLQELNLSSTSVTDAGLKELAGLKSLQRLGLDGIKVTDAGLKVLVGFKNLQMLSLVNTKVTDAGLKELAGLKSLVQLNLGGTQVTDQSLEDLMALSVIGELSLVDTRISAKGYATLKAELPKATIEWSEPNYAAAIAVLKNGGDIYIQIKGQPKDQHWDLREPLVLPKEYFKITRVNLTRLKKTAGGVPGALVKLTDPKFDGLKTLSLYARHEDGWLEALAKLLPHLENLDLHESDVRDEHLKHLAGCTALKDLNLAATGITNAGLGELTKLTGLEKLNLGNSDKLTDFGLRHLKNMTRLKWLNLENTAVTSAGMVYLEGLKNLEFLALPASGLPPLKGLTNLQTLKVGGITDDGLSNVKHCPDLKELHLGNSKVTDEGLSQLKTLKNLDTLALYGLKISGPGLAQLRDLAKLKSLTLWCEEVTDGSLKYVSELSNLESLVLRETRIEGSGLVHLKKLKKLTSLAANSTNVGDAGLEHLKELTGLTYLELARTPITDKGLPSLYGLKNLRFLGLVDTGKVTAAGVAALRKALPKCQVVSDNDK